jgi:hypothetical protein
MTRRIGALARRATVLATVAVSTTAAAAAVVGAPGTAHPVPPKHHAHAACHLDNGVKHVINIVFDNVHFFRDNPNVPSDLEQMPHLLNFLESNGTVFSNVHTPLIAHTADDSLSIYTGLYGDRHGQPLTNTYKTYNPDGTTDPATSFAYWTSPAADTAAHPAAGHDTSPTMAYSTSPAKNPGKHTSITPAPWVPFTRAGCSVGDFSTANMVLENTNPDLATVFGQNSPEVAQYTADPDSYKDPEVADYVGVAVHCAKGDAICAKARGVKYGQTAPSPTAVADQLPSEPGGYHHFQALFGARYVAPQIGGGTPNVAHHGYPVTDANGNLTDLDGNTIVNGYANNQPGFPGFSPTPSQTLAYLADMQEAGVPVTYGYISDLHERKAGTSGCTTAPATGTGYAIGPGDSCYVDNAKAYDDAFATFFARLQADGITPHNTEFVISAEENDQFSGANVGRAIQPSPAGCDGVTTPCSYTADQIGELQANITGLLSGTASSGTQFDIEPQGASIYVHGQPAATDPAVRQLERDTAAMTADDPFTGVNGEHIVNYQADQIEQRILHMQTADPLRTPTYTMFPKPDYYFSTSGTPNVTVNPRYAWNHGYYSPNIDITWAGIAGPGAANRGVDGPGPAAGNETQDPNSTKTVPEASTRGTWVEEVDLRPTLLHLLGLRDDYLSDGAPIAAALRHPGRGIAELCRFTDVYHQLNSSDGNFATDTLIADTHALAGGSSGGDNTYRRTIGQLRRLDDQRDALADAMKHTLAAAARSPHRRFAGRGEGRLLIRAEALLWEAHWLAQHS